MKIQKIKKIKKEICDEDNKKTDEKYNMVKINARKANKEIEQIRSEMYYGLQSNLKDIKLHPKYYNIKKKVDEVNNKEIDDLVDFAKGLDFEKYMKDLQIREAMNLIKIKINEEKKEEELLDENLKDGEKNENEIIDYDENNSEYREYLQLRKDANIEGLEKIEDEKSNDVILPKINNNNIQQDKNDIIEHDNQWGVRIFLL